MFSETIEPAYRLNPTPVAPLASLAQEYIAVCDRYERLQQELAKLTNEIKEIGGQRIAIRQRLISMISEMAGEPVEEKAASWR